jgi:predicted PurR-regulated permease PerM
LIVLGVTVGLFLVWQTSSSLLVIFVGILLASFLDACARALGSVLSVDRVRRLTLVVLILMVLIVLGIIWGAGKLPEQARVFIRTHHGYALSWPQSRWRWVAMPLGSLMLIWAIGIYTVIQSIEG